MKQSKHRSQEDSYIKRNNFAGDWLDKKSKEIIKKIEVKYEQIK